VRWGTKDGRRLAVGALSSRRVSGPLCLGVLVSGSGTNLQALLDSVHGHEARIVGVASSSEEAPALERARAAGVPARAFPMSDFAGRAPRDEAIADWLLGSGATLVVLAGYMQLLGASFLRRFPGAVINVHPSLLPAFPGIRAIEQAVDHGVRVTGVTVHFVDEGVDTGPIILQRAIEIDPSMNAEQVHERLQPAEHELLPSAVRLFAAGRLGQDPANRRRVLIDPAHGLGGQPRGPTAP
jgi:phosphoribosylglycinamide formyltransferase 1